MLPPLRPYFYKRRQMITVCYFVKYSKKVHILLQFNLILYTLLSGINTNLRIGRDTLCCWGHQKESVSLFVTFAIFGTHTNRF